MKLTALKIGARLGGGFAIVIGCTLCLLGVALWGMTSVKNSTDVIVTDRFNALTSAMDMREAGWSIALNLRRQVAPTDAAEAEREAKSLAEILNRYQEAQQRVISLLYSANAKANLEAVQSEHKQVLSTIAQIQSQIAASNFFDAATLIKKTFQPQHERWMASLIRLASGEQELMQQTQDEMNKRYATTMAGIIILGVLILAIGVIVAWKITRTITVPLKHAEAFAKEISEGVLTSKVVIEGKDEVAVLLHALRKMQEYLLGTVTQIQQGARAISEAAGEIATGNGNLSARTETQAAALEMSASSMETLTSTVGENAARAVQAEQAIVTASVQAVNGGEVVDQVVSTMADIKDSASKIVDIIGVIDGLAFQTNLLALNAAVEAARAGEQGRGFAVVAAEVRGLAQRSASAAKEIKTLIGSSVDKVEAGSVLVTEAGGTMQGIVTSVKHAAGLMQAISAANQEQSTEIAAIHRAIAEMDQTTQQNAALVEQAFAAANTLDDQAKGLVTAVSKFVIASDSTPNGVRRGF